MNIPASRNGLLSADAFATSARSSAVLPSNRAQDAPPDVLRHYTVARLGPDGTEVRNQHRAPATPAFEAAFSAFARGTLIATPNGPCAIEDLAPGDEICTLEEGTAPVVWIGSMTLQPEPMSPGATRSAMTRIMADTLGMSRPLQDTLFGPAARILHRPAALRDLEDRGLVYVPLRDMIDGGGIIPLTPPCPTPLFHLCTPRHATILAAGLEVETYHPGSGMFDDMSRAHQLQYLAIFGHIKKITDFGRLAHPRASMAMLDSLSAA